MSSSPIRLTQAEIQKAMQGPDGSLVYPPIINTEEAARMLRIAKSTLYDWMRQGKLNGAYRRRGKHALFVRDRLIKLVFEGPDW